MRRDYFVGLGLTLFLLPPPAQPQVLTSITPVNQRVHGYVEVEGGAFGASQGASQVIFTDGVDQWPAGTAYLWRDNYIRIRVPVGKSDGGAIVPISKEALSVFVATTGGTSATLPFRVVSVAGGSATFRQLTSIAASHADTSTVLGSPNMNSARTKDAEVADVNDDGWPDLQDNNSNNISNSSHSVLRLNEQDRSFSATALEPLNAADAGTFATEVPAGGDYFENHTSYDADYADINNDRLPDLLQTAANNVGGTDHRMRILINNHDGIAGRFVEQSAARMPATPFGGIGCPDDLDHIDMDADGDVDFLVTMRTATGFCSGATSEIRVFSNDGTGAFLAPIVIPSRSDNSTHDAFWIDANNDGDYDIVAANEWNNADFNDVDVQSQLFLNDGAGGFSENRTFALAASAGDAADFNGDGLTDFVIGRTAASVFLTRTDSPCLSNSASQCTYDEVPLVAAGGFDLFYDLEIGDLDLDGFPDIVGALIQPGPDNILIWINRGDGTFDEITGGISSTVLPGHDGTYQRLSADLLDFDLDGDLDLYVTGQDGQDHAPAGTGSGRGPNQFFENLLVSLDIASPTQAVTAYAGSATGGRKVLVRLWANLAVAGLVPADFAVTVDGTPLAASAIVTGGAIEEEYWLLVQMPARPNGCYDLEVALAADPAISDTEHSSLCYEDERLFDRAMAVDRTRSMLAPTAEKMEAARAAAAFFVNLSEDDDEIGVTSFKRAADDGDGAVEQHELAQTDFALVPAVDPVTGDDRRDDAILAVDDIEPDGADFSQETSIGAGLQQAWNQLTARGNPDHEWEIILLTDGLENFAPFWAVVAPGMPLGAPPILPLKPQIEGADPAIRVHTVAVGENAASDILMDIAEGTGGQFFNLYEGTASYGLMSRLAAVYKYIDEEIRDEQRFFYREGLPDPVAVGAWVASHLTGFDHQVARRIDTFYVPQDFESITVGFHWNRDHGLERVLLYDPAGDPIAPSPPTRTIESDPKHKIYRIRDPQPGWYNYEVELGTAIPFEFFAVASGVTDLIAVDRRGEIRETSPGHYEVPLRLVVGDFDPVLFASVAGEVILPDKTRIPITLHDDGVHEDALSRDGIYGQLFAHTMPGGYMAELVTTGTSNRNEPFTRYSVMSWAFPGGNQDPDEPDPGDLGGGDPDDDDDRGLAYSFHVGSSHPLGSFNDGFDANIHLRLDVSYPLRDNLRALVMLGFSQFTADLSSGADNQWWANLSANLKMTMPTTTSLRYYVQAGPGVYEPKSGSADLGFNVGFGGQIPLSAGCLNLEFGTDYHYVVSDHGVHFITAQIGVLW